MEEREKNPAAVALGKLRAAKRKPGEQAAVAKSAWADLTEEERSEEMKRRMALRKAATRPRKKTRKLQKAS